MVATIKVPTLVYGPLYLTFSTCIFYIYLFHTISRIAATIYLKTLICQSFECRHSQFHARL